MIVISEEQSTLVSRWRARSSLAQPLHLANIERACSPGSMDVLKLEDLGRTKFTLSKFVGVL